MAADPSNHRPKREDLRQCLEKGIAMQDVFSSIQLSKLPTPLKLTISLTLVVLGIGYLIALLNLHLTYHLTDGKEIAHSHCHFSFSRATVLADKAASPPKSPLKAKAKSLWASEY